MRSTFLLRQTRNDSRLGKTFFANDGLRSGWRLLLFLLLLAVFESGLRKVMVQVPPIYRILKAGQNGVIGPLYEFLFETALIIGMFFSAVIMSKIERRVLGQYGLPRQGAFGKLFWQGVFWGLVFECLEVLGIFAFGGLSFGSQALSGWSVPLYALGWGMGFILVGIAEEFLFRGYAQFTLGQGVGFWPSAICLSALFGALHLRNIGEGWAGALSVTLFGLFACFTLRRTGSLWFAVGFHAASDYAETFLFSVPDSGILARGQLLHSTLHGPFVVFARLYPAGIRND